MIVKCISPGCGGTEFVPASTVLARVPVYEFERKSDRIIRRDVGDRVACARCGRVQAITAAETFVMTTEPAHRSRPSPNGAPERDPEPVPTSIVP